MKKIKIKGTDEVIYFEKSTYDMPVYIWENNNLNGFYLSLCVKYGSLHTKFQIDGKSISVPNGIAHYLEHIKFNEKKDVRANDFFDKIGSDINAFTTFEYTNYEVTGHDNYKDNLSHLIYYVLNPYFTKEIINKERGIITEEIKMDKDDPYSKLFYRSLSNVFFKSHYKYMVSGEIDDIKQISLENIATVYNAFYHPQNMFLVVCGNVDRYKTLQIVNDTLSKIQIPNYKNANILIEKEPNEVVKEEDIYEDNVMIPKTKICIKIPVSKFKGLDKEKILIYSRIILDANFGNTSDFKEELLESNMVNTFNAHRSIFEDYLILSFTYESDVYNAVKEKILNKLKKLDISSSYLKRIIKCNLSNLIISFENKEIISGLIQNDIIEFNEIRNEVIDTYKKIKVDDLNKITKILNSKNIAVTTVIPKQ